MRSVVLAVALGGCQITGTFECSIAEQCNAGDTIGVCIAGSCAHVDDTCTGGYRYEETAADEVAGACFDATPPADCAAWMPRHFSPCASSAPIGSIQISSTGNYDTDAAAFSDATPHMSSIVTQLDGTQLRVISVVSFTVDSGVTLGVTGSLPLVIAAWDSISIAGRIDANSRREGNTGAGANSMTCSGATPGQVGLELGSGGGGGGGFGGTGGTGGTGGAAMVAMGGARGAVVAMPIAHVRGGCPGTPGGAAGPAAVAPATPASQASGGAGGGAFQLTARRTLSITGSLRAGGAGGSAGPANSGAGGGGGGSGGFIGLEAPMVLVTGTVSANGGAGGGGAHDLAAGSPGADAAGLVPAKGGAGAVAVPPSAGCTGVGADGSAAATLTGANANSAGRACGGGGGGGGAGVVTVRSPMYVAMPPAAFSPPVVIDPP